MRILHLIDHFATGGAQILLADLLRSWPCENDAFTVVGLGRNRELAERVAAIRNVEVEVWNRRRWEMASLFGLLRRARAERYDAVHAHLVKSIGAALLLGVFAKQRTVIHLHGGVEEFPAPLLGVYRALCRMGGATRVVAISDSMKRFALDRLGVREERVRLIPNGVPAEMFERPPQGEAVRSELGIPADALVVGMVGRLVEQKGVDVFVEAFAQVRESEPKAVGVVVGDGPLRGKLSAMAREEGCAGAFRFVGWREDVIPYYDAFDIGAVPSKWEPFGIVTLEMMARCIPVVGCAVGGVPEIIEDGRSGLLVPPRDPRRLADAVLRLARDAGLRARLGRSGRARALERFRVDDVARDVRGMYLEMLDDA